MQLLTPHNDGDLTLETEEPSEQHFQLDVFRVETLQVKPDQADVREAVSVTSTRPAGLLTLHREGSTPLLCLLTRSDEP